MNIKMLKAAVAGLVLSVSGLANAGLITEDFTTGTYTTNNGNVVTAQNITFSHNLLSHNDGFQLRNNEVINWYGEKGQYFTFDNEYFLNSIDFSEYNAVNYGATNLNVYLYNNNNDLINLVNFDIDPQQSTYTFNTYGVKKVLIDWTGPGFNVYNDGRQHAWYSMDNITYDTDRAAGIPEPSTLAIFALGIMGLASRRLKK